MPFFDAVRYVWIIPALPLAALLIILGVTRPLRQLDGFPGRRLPPMPRFDKRLSDLCLEALDVWALQQGCGAQRIGAEVMP